MPRTASSPCVCFFSYLVRRADRAPSRVRAQALDCAVPHLDDVHGELLCIRGRTSVLDSDRVPSDDGRLVSSPWPAALRERERQLPYFSPPPAHSFRPVEDARDQIALDRCVRREERNDRLDVVPRRGGFQIAEELLYRGDLLLFHAVSCAPVRSARCNRCESETLMVKRARSARRVRPREATGHVVTGHGARGGVQPV